MQTAEFASPDQAAASSASGIWLIEALRWTGETNRVPVPDGWTVVRSDSFPDGSGADAEIVLHECADRPGPLD